MKKKKMKKLRVHCFGLEMCSHEHWNITQEDSKVRLMNVTMVHDE